MVGTKQKSTDWRRESRSMFLRKELSKFQKEFRKNMITMITGAFAFVAALFWRDALLEVFKVLAPENGILAFKLVTALVISVIAVVAVVIISRLGEIKGSQ